MASYPSNMMRNLVFLVGAAALLVVGTALPVAANPQSGVGVIDRSRPTPDGRATKITVGIYLIDLIEVRGAAQSFVADVAVRAVWNDPRLAGRWPEAQTLPRDDVWNPALEVVNERSLRSVFPDEVEVDPSGRVEYRQRYLGEFAAPMDLRAFPFDSQTFRVQLVSIRYSTERVEIASETDPDWIGRPMRLSVSDWAVGPTRIEVGTLSLVRGEKENPTAVLLFDADRQPEYYVVQVFLPLAMIVLMAWTVFWLDPSIIPTRLSVVVTTMLTLIAYRFALAGQVPRLPYLTRLDFFLLGLTVIVFLTLLVMAAASYLFGRGYKDAAARINRWGRALFPASVAAIVAAVWWA